MEKRRLGNSNLYAAPIASATSLKQLESLLNAAQLKLSNDAIEMLNKASDWK